MSTTQLEIRKVEEQKFEILIIFQPMAPATLNYISQEQGDISNIAPSGNGAHIYVKDDENYVEPLLFSAVSRDHHIQIISFLKKDIKIVKFYIDVKTSVQYIRDVFHRNAHFFEGDNVVVYGNFNETMIQELHSFLQIYEMEILSSMVPTFFGRLKSYVIKVEMFECFFSNLKPIIIKISKK